MNFFLLTYLIVSLYNIYMIIFSMNKLLLLALLGFALVALTGIILTE